MFLVGETRRPVGECFQKTAMASKPVVLGLKPVAVATGQIRLLVVIQTAMTIAGQTAVLKTEATELKPGVVKAVLSTEATEAEVGVAPIWKKSAS